MHSNSKITDQIKYSKTTIISTIKIQLWQRGLELESIKFGGRYQVQEENIGSQNGQRFICIHQGKKDIAKQKTNHIMHICLV